MAIYQFVRNMHADPRSGDFPNLNLTYALESVWSCSYEPGLPALIGLACFAGPVCIPVICDGPGFWPGWPERFSTDLWFLPTSPAKPGIILLSVQYCTLCAVFMEKCAVLNAKMCRIEISNVLSSVSKS